MRRALVTLTGKAVGVAHNISSFINENLEPILIEWEKHATSLMGANVSAADARDHAKGMLLAIVADMQEGQTPEEQSDKSQGLGPRGGGKRNCTALCARKPDLAYPI